MREVPYDAISTVEAIKRDQITSDLICFLIWTEASAAIEVHEDMEGFEQLAERLARLPGFHQAWREKVATPPFSANRTVVYEAG